MNAPDTAARLKPSQLNERAMLVKLTIRKAALTKRDEEAEAVIQQQLNDGSLMVNRKLFRDPQNPVSHIVSSLGQAYTFHKRHTFPYLDKGPRIVGNTVYLEYAAQMKERVREVEAMMNRVLPNYDQYVLDDIRYRTQGPTPPRASVADYPTAYDFKAATSISVLPMPLPDARHFLFDMPDEEMQAFSEMQERIESVVRTDTVRRMLKPLRHLTDKLAVPIGEGGGVFRDSAVENIVESVELVRKIGVIDDPEINLTVRELLQTVEGYSQRMEWLRESPIMRAEAHAKLDAIANKMAAFI
jgi:hypothetical protein